MIAILRASSMLREFDIEHDDAIRVVKIGYSKKTFFRSDPVKTDRFMNMEESCP